jgi:dihydroorotate dehydrogenase
MTDLAFRIARPLLYRLDPETAHHLAIWALKNGLIRGKSEADAPVLATEIWGRRFSNPIGLAAGFDKDAEVMDAMLGLGFGFVEAGTVTPLPQPGNPKPRLFRLDDDGAIINRFGFNSLGLAAFVERLRQWRARGPRGILGANLGKNRETADAAADYVTGIEAVCGFADYLVVNLSSPNTPGVRALQARQPIEDLLIRVIQARHRAAPDPAHLPPLLAKVGPDLTDEELDDIAEVATGVGIDGLIIGNTTIARPQNLTDPRRGEGGGLSGRPLMVPSTLCLAKMYRRVGRRLPIIGCGGIASGADAYAKLRAGASLVQLYSALVFGGPGLVGIIKHDLAERLRADGFESAGAAVGADHR